MGIFITMNPGYAGRTELPESIKAMFRPVTCVKPDLELICVISLFSDGFLTAKVNQWFKLFCSFTLNTQLFVHRFLQEK